MSLISGILGITSTFLLAQKCFPNSPSPQVSPSPNLPLAHTHKLPHSHTHKLPHSHTHTLPHSHTHTLPHSHTHTLTHSHTPSPNLPLWTAFFYAFSPVFMRYNHWATGRGLFIAIFPLFLLALINLSKIEVQKVEKRRALFVMGNLAGLISLGIFLTLSHKAGLIALLLILASLLPGILLSRLNWRWLAPALTIIALSVAIALSPNRYSTHFSL